MMRSRCPTQSHIRSTFGSGQSVPALNSLCFLNNSGQSYIGNATTNPLMSRRPRAVGKPDHSFGGSVGTTEPTPP